MKMLKQLALVTAVAAVSTSSFALEQLDDETLAQTTGQDGITITISPDDKVGIQIDKLMIHDNEGISAVPTGSKFTANELGLGSATSGTAGAIVLDTGAKDKTGTATTKGLVIQGGNIAINVDTDGGGTGNDPFINANIKMSGTTHIGIGKVQVAKSNATQTAYNGTTAGQRGVTGTAKNILGALSLKMDGGEMNVQLGAQPQGAMVKMKSTIKNGLTLENLEVIDADGYSRDAVAASGGNPAIPAITGSPGSLLVKKLVLTDTGSADMSMDAQVDIDSKKGIVIEMASPTGGYYAYMEDVGIGDGAGTGTFAKIGTAPNTVDNIIGDVEIVGLEMGKSTISISGH